jgi:hypothetical protein
VAVEWLAPAGERGRERTEKASRTITVNEKLSLIVTNVCLRIWVIGDNMFFRVSVSLPRRLCAGANPQLRRLRSLPPMDQSCQSGTSYSVVSFSSPLDRVRGCPVLGPRDAETGTLRDYVHTLRRGHGLRPQRMFATKAFLLERCSATFSLDKVPPFPSACFYSTPQVTWPCFQPQSSTTATSPFSPFCVLSVLVSLSPFFHAVAILFSMAKLNSARNFFERARMMTVGSFSVS